MSHETGIQLCHDTRCGAREQCERWLMHSPTTAASKPSDRQRQMHAMTLKQGWMPHSGPCLKYIGPTWPETDEETSA